MKKNWLIGIIILMTFVSFSNVYALQTSAAKENIDISKKVTLTLTYHYDDLKFNDVSVKVYHIASLINDLTYQLTDDFVIYPIMVNGLKTQQEWDMLEETVKSYIKRDNIDPIMTGVIIDNQLQLTDLPVGLYLIETDNIDEDHYILKYDSFLINLPILNEDGTWNYDVSIYPKGYEYVPKYDEINYIVVKEWQDNEKNRPDSVNIEIYKNDKLVEEKVLSSTNNWSYEWIGLDDGSEWYVLEKNVPNNYKVSISKKDNVFIILNSAVFNEEENPRTLDNINLYLYLFLGSLVSLIIMILYLIKRRKA